MLKKLKYGLFKMRLGKKWNMELLGSGVLANRFVTDYEKYSFSLHGRHIKKDFA